ncbi:unnamed protein product [Mucor hiemalis]
MSSVAIEENMQVMSKAGRHRLYSNEQRKDRNRQAQAAFRDRRSKYQKTLEAAMLKYEDTIEDLKQENMKSTERAVEAEQRCRTLDAEVADLRKSLQLALAENQRILSSSYVATPGSPSYSVPEINSPPPSAVSSAIPNYDFLFNSQQPEQLQVFSSQDTFGTSWLPYNIGESPKLS